MGVATQRYHKNEISFTKASFFLDFAKSVGIMTMATAFGLIFSHLGFSEANIITVYILGVLIISVITSHRIYSFIFSLISVIIFNFFFTEPKFTLIAYDNGDPVTFLVMFLSAFMTSSLAVKLKTHARFEAERAYRTQILFDTNQLLGQAEGREAIATATATQLVKLLSRDIVIYLREGDALQAPLVFPAPGHECAAVLISSDEQEKALQFLKQTYDENTDASSVCLYFPIGMNTYSFGVVGIALDERTLGTFEKSIVLSILGECALALENEKNAREKEEAAIMAKNEQLQANLLRAISHDLRTPLTSISGNASNLLSNGDNFDEETKRQLYTDIYDDAMWLVGLVENLLAVTRIEQGKMNLHFSVELMDEVIQEALTHVNRHKASHRLVIKETDELLLARMDARLIVQVLINLIDNAVKYTPDGSTITISAWRKENSIMVSIADNGPGIADDLKEQVFEMFYSGAHPIADSRRSLGLGLSLCKSIVMAHGGSIWVQDSPDQGADFIFTLPAEEVTLHE